MSYTHAKVVYAVISVVQIYHRATDVDTFTLKYSDLPIDVSVSVLTREPSHEENKRKARLPTVSRGSVPERHKHPTINILLVTRTDPYVRTHRHGK